MKDDEEQDDFTVESKTSDEKHKPRGHALSGRPKGVPNKLSMTAKENIVAVFTRIGGTASMARWARRHRTEFYRLYARLIPTEMAGSVTVVYDAEGLDRKILEALGERVHEHAGGNGGDGPPLLPLKSH